MEKTLCYRAKAFAYDPLKIYLKLKLLKLMARVLQLNN